MTNHVRSLAEEEVPEAFLTQVKDALKHLYDFPHLEHHALTQELSSADTAAAETPGQRLRREMLTVIEMLDPGPDVPFEATHARPYNMLRLTCVEGLTVQEAAHELNISMRQAFRDLRRGCEGAAELLWARCSGGPARHLGTPQATSVQAELARLEVHPHPTDLRALCQQARAAVDRLAAQQGIRLEVSMPLGPVSVLTDPLVARQVLINTLSQAIGRAQPGELSVTLRPKGQETWVTVDYAISDQARDAAPLDPVVAQLADRLAWQVKEENRSGTAHRVVLRMEAHRLAVLVIDDNEGLAQLMERYLADQAYQVIAAAEGREGLRMAEELLPAAIVLDVMMPEMDGWELLQRLRTNLRTKEIPVIICSVINDPDLASSLGASAFLSKPINREAIWAALHRLNLL